MQAKDVMTTALVTVGPDEDVRRIAKLLLEHRISAVPVVDGEGRVLGIVSEGDLMRRPESGTQRHPSWWLSLLVTLEGAQYAKSHGRLAREVMTREVVSVSEDTPLEEIATILEERHIKRVPVLRDGRLVGIVSRANLLHGLVARSTAAAVPSDREIKAHVVTQLQQAGIGWWRMNVVVSGGVVHLWGGVDSEAEKLAARIALGNVDGVRDVQNHLSVFPPGQLGAR